MSSGAMDTQDLLVWGRVHNNTMLAERQRILDLCEWGKDFGIDGYVRMEMSFEIMHCDFAQGLELVSSLHLLPAEGGGLPRGRPSPPTVPRIPPVPNDPDARPPPPFHLVKTPGHPNVPPPFPTGSPRHPPDFPSEPRPPSWKGALPKEEERGFEVFQAGAWHNQAPGEVRVKIDAARLVSLCDPALRSGTRLREGKEKVLHRGKGMSDEDISTWRGWIEDVLREDAPATSGVDWPALTTVIMDRYGARLEYLQSLLHPDRVIQNATAVVRDVRAQLMLMLLTDITADYIPTPTSSTPAAHWSQVRRRETQNDTWVEPIATHCSSFLVSHLPKERMTREERTLYTAVSGTQAEICRVLSLLWAEAYDPSPLAQEDMVKDWRDRIDGLMRWLDWPMWNRCRPECSLDTMCFIPTWPAGVGDPPMSGEEEDLSKINWTPKCIPRGKDMFGPRI
ncbi:hypothetical protein FRC10_011883 [Ceratobasidium sp. 414]|nr:hypothetical protein FRC10_011883 [Ceratobasidium sp. 414]